MQKPNTPNILFLFTDQFRFDCIAALGNSKIKTPNIDRLVRDGTTFTACYTPSPVCCPARRSLSCGLPPHITGCVDNVDAYEAFPSVMEKLGELGYQTHGVGKMHFSPDVGDWGFSSRDVSEELAEDSERDDYRDYLQENGYDHVIDPHGIRSEYYYLPQPSQLPDKAHHTRWVADRSIDFLQNRDRSKPFFLWSSFIKPHPPFESPNPWGRLYRMHEMDLPVLHGGYEDNWTFWNTVQNRFKYTDGFAENRNLSRTITAAYYGTISYIDFHIGRILDSLGSDLDNTLVVFSSDHGELLGDFGCYGKRSMLNASVRVPLIACLPDVFPENHRCDTPATLLDLFPTFTSIANSRERPPSPEGLPLANLLEKTAEDRIVFSQFSQNGLGLYMAANARWKYIYSAADDKEWLFNLENDPQELDNKSGDPEFKTEYNALKLACIKRFQEGGYTGPLIGDEWKRFPRIEAPRKGTDDGFLFQDPVDLEEQIKTLGAFARSSEFTKDERFKLFDKLREVSAPKEASRNRAP